MRFYTIEKYSFSIKQSQIFLFAFLAAGALGTFFGGPLADKFGSEKDYPSIHAPFRLLIFNFNSACPGNSGILLAYPYNGFTLMSSFSVTVVYAQELVPGKIGTMSGLTVGLAFGMGAVGSIALGIMADHFGLLATLTFTGLLPILGALGFFLPSDQKLANRS